MTTQKTTKSFSQSLAFSLMLTISIAGSVAAHTRVSPSISANAAAIQEGNIYTIKEAGLQFEIPKGWKVEKDGDNIIVSFEDGAASVTFVVEERYQDVVTGMKSGLKEKLTELKSDGEAKQDTHNGMTHISESGAGLLKEVKVTWRIDVLKATKNVTILTFGVEKILEAHGEEYAKFVSSIKKT
jgi:hypothetical protein